MEKIAAYLLVLILVVLAIGTSSCTMLTGESLTTGEDEGRLLLSTDRAGLEAFGDMMTGLVTTGKASPDVDDSHHELRRHQGETLRAKYSRAKSLKGGK